MQGIAVLDAGGQYCHLLARRVRELGVQSHVLPMGAMASQVSDISGVIISGGPRCATEAGSPRIDAAILLMGAPVLAICYGHQLLAATMPGGVVRPSVSREYGVARLTLTPSAHLEAANGAFDLFQGIPDSSHVWMSHGDSVVTLPEGFDVLGLTDECAVAAMGHAHRRIFGVQFHPEVTHTEHGQALL